MSTLNIFTEKIKSIIDGNDELKNSVILSKVLESVKYTGDDIKYLTDLNESVSDVNAYLNNKDLTDVISSIEQKINELKNTDEAVIASVSNEFNALGLLEGVLNSTEHSDLVLKNLVSSMISELKTSRVPSYVCVNPIKEHLSKFNSYNVVKEAIAKCDEYINNNAAKLMVVDAANYFEIGNGHGVNTKAVSVLAESLRNNNFNPDMLEQKFGSMANEGTCKALLKSLREQRGNDVNGFSLGNGANGTKVFDYVGPMLQEGTDVTFCVNGSYINISQSEKSADIVERVIEGKEETKVVELKPLHVFNTNKKFFQTEQAFESLGFKMQGNAATAKLTRTNYVSFAVNESNKVDLIYNGNVSTLESIKRDGTQMFESNNTKLTLYSLLENNDQIYHLGFVKFIVNENKGTSMVINIGKNYYIYDTDVRESKTDVYKLDAFQLYEFCLNKYQYDISSNFGFAVNDARSKFAEIEKDNCGIKEVLTLTNESISKIDKAMSAKDIDASDYESLKSLKESFEQRIKDLNERLEKNCKLADDIINFKSKKISEGLTLNESGDASQGESNLEGSTQPEDNTTQEQTQAQDAGAQPADTGDDSQSQDVNEGKLNETLGDEGTKCVKIIFIDGSEETQQVDSELSDETIQKMFAPGTMVSGKEVANYELCAANKAEGLENQTDVVKEVNEVNGGIIAIPEWAVSAIVENDFRGLGAQRYSESLEFRNQLAASGVKRIEIVDRAPELLKFNAMTESQETCVYLKYQLNENIFKGKLYGIEKPFAGITNLGLFKDGQMKKACNTFLDEVAPIILNKCRFGILKALVDMKANNEGNLDDGAKSLLDAYKQYDAASIEEEIKTAEETINMKTEQLDALAKKFIANKPGLAAAFKYDVLKTKSTMLQIKAAILKGFREGKLEGSEDAGKFAASQTAVNLAKTAEGEAVKQSGEANQRATEVEAEAKKAEQSGGNSNQGETPNNGQAKEGENTNATGENNQNNHAENQTGETTNATGENTNATGENNQNNHAENQTNPVRKNNQNSDEKNKQNQTI